MPALVRAAILGGARPLPVPSEVRTEERVQHCAVHGERRRERSWLTPASALGLGLHSLVGPRSLGLVLACLFMDHPNG
jgi:hypothetical protein